MKVKMKNIELEKIQKAKILDVIKIWALKGYEITTKKLALYFAGQDEKKAKLLEDKIDKILKILIQEGNIEEEIQ